MLQMKANHVISLVWRSCNICVNTSYCKPNEINTDTEIDLYIYRVLFCILELISRTLLRFGARGLVLNLNPFLFCCLNSTREADLLILTFPHFLFHAIIWGAPELSSALSNDGCNDSVAKLMYLLFVIYPGINHALCRRATDKWAVRKSTGVRCLKACIYHGVMITRHYSWAGLD